MNAVVIVIIDALVVIVTVLAVIVLVVTEIPDHVAATHAMIITIVITVVVGIVAVIVVVETRSANVRVVAVMSDARDHAVVVMIDANETVKIVASVPVKIVLLNGIVTAIEVSLGKDQSVCTWNPLKRKLPEITVST